MEEVILSIKIENKKPVELNQLTVSLNALSRQYDSFLKRSNCTKSDRKLYLHKLERGSVIVELVAASIPLFSDINTIMTFFNYLKSSFEYFLGKSEAKYQYSRQDLEEMHSIIEQTSKDNGSSTSISIKNGDVTTNIYNVSYIDANAAQNGIKRYLENIETVRPAFFSKELMYWANANFVKNKKAHDKVVIEKIDKHPKKVIFANDEDKLYATTHNSLFKDKNWQDLAYIVDVDVSYIEDVPKEYKILRIYREEVFDPEE